MGFRLPTFNLRCNVWHSGSVVYAAPDVALLACNLSPAGKGFQVRATGLLASNPTTYMILRMPALADVRAVWNSTPGDQIECPAGSQRMYSVTAVDDIGKGFPNEHRFAEMFMVPGGGVLFVPPIPVPVPLP